MHRHKLHHYIFPHHKTHKKAHLLSEKALAVYVLVFVFLQIGLKFIPKSLPGVLGTTSAITREEIITLTNGEREKYGVDPLKESSQLDAAAEQKAKNMFAENYWAHVSPSGKTPWVWIQQEGYTYRFAGENLARSFSTSNSVVEAWMASKQGHKENLLNNKYQDIGIAVEDGIINGEKTTLVVQLFGTPASAVASIDTQGASTVADKNSQIAVNAPAKPAVPMQVNSVSTMAPRPSFLNSNITLNPVSVTRTFGFSLIGLLLALTAIDLYVIARRRRLVSLYVRHLPHATFMLIVAILIFSLSSGMIL